MSAMRSAFACRLHSGFSSKRSRMDNGNIGGLGNGTRNENGWNPVNDRKWTDDRDASE